MQAIDDAIALITALAGDDWEAAYSLERQSESEDLAIAAAYVASKIAKHAALALEVETSEIMQTVALEFADLRLGGQEEEGR